MWRLPAESFATLQEVETHYSLADVIRANTILDCRAWTDYYTLQRNKQK